VQEVQIGRVAGKMAADLRSLAGVVRCSDRDNEQLMWGNVVVSHAEKAAVLATNIRKVYIYMI
jgi:hypothetical protein